MRTRPFSPVFSVLAAGLAAGLMLAPVDRAEAASPRETEAARLFFAGQYPDALKIYVDLAVATGDPVYMCEIGRCYHRMGKLEEASRNLRDCLTQAQLAPKKKREFQTLQAEVEAARKAAAAPPPPAAPPAYAAPVGGPPPGAPPAYGAGPPPGAPQGYPPPGAPPAYPPQGQPGYPPQAQGYPPPGGPPPGQAPQGYPGYAQGPQGGPQNGPPGGPGQPPPWGAQPPGPPPENMGPPPGNQLSAGVDQPPSSGGGWMKPTAYIAGGIGLAGIGTGIFAGLTASKKFDEVAKEYNENKHKNAKTYNTLQYVGYGLGGAALGAGILFFILAPSDDARASADRLQIVASPDSVGIAGRF